MKKLVAMLAVACMASAAMAQPFYVAGSFNGWNVAGDLMTEITPGVQYQATISSLSGNHAFKVTDGTWDNAWPANNMEIGLGGGDLTINFFPGAFGDGWNPPDNRVGIVDPEAHGWEIMGDFNGWASPVATMTGMGGGMYSVTFNVDTPGTHFFKFRKPGDWGVSIGDLDVGGNAQLTTTLPNESVSLELDLAGGRWRVVPEPATIALLGMGGFALLRRRR